MLKVFAYALAAFALGSSAANAACADRSFEGSNFTVCSFDPNLNRLATFNLDASGEPYGRFARLAAELAKSNMRLTFAMNAGMFDENLKPIGLYIENGKTLKKLNRRNGFGNFHLKPNGVFFLEGKSARVLDTDAFVKSDAKPDFASQSGPMLVIDGKIHPKFSEKGTSFKIRNGVGVTKDGLAVFVLSHGVVTFHQFARVFRDGLNTPNALFLDGSVSSIYSTELGRNEGFLPLGPMVGVVELR